MAVGRWVWVWGGGEVGVGEGRWVLGDHGTCEDRGCENVGSVQEVSTHTLICYINHPSTVHSIGQI